MSTLIIDIEADGLLYEATKIHCIVIKELTGLFYYFFDGDCDFIEMPDGVQVKRTGLVSAAARLIVEKNPDRIVGHNFAGYDIPLLKKFVPTLDVEWWLDKVWDSMLVSQMVDPARASHSLESYGIELDYPKQEHEDWSTFTPEMLYRCATDVILNEKVYCRLLKKTIPNYINPALDIEQWVSFIHSQQTQHGVRFDTVSAVRLLNTLSERRSVLELQIQDEAPWKCRIPNVPIKYQELYKDRLPGVAYRELPPISPFKKNGKLKKAVVDYIGEEKAHTVKGMYTKIECTPLSLSSSGELKEYLMSIGWKPTEWNYKFVEGEGKQKTSPKISEDSFKSLPDGLGAAIHEWNVLSHRVRYLYSTTKKVPTGALTTVRPDGRVPAEARTLGTPTCRYRHSKTVCNLPRPSTLYGKEIRALLCAPDNRHMLGLDLSGIEARMLAHYVMTCEGGPELAKIITEGDFHQHNADMWEVDRNTAKSGLYALMYGCFPKKLASTLGKPASKAQELYDMFWEVNAPIRELVDRLEAQLLSDGRISGLDGRPIFIREKRKLLNSLLQSAAAMVFKVWMVKCYRSYREGFDPRYTQVIAYHDELQFEVYSSNVDSVEMLGKVFAGLALEAGRSLKVRVPTPADYKIGHNWADTH